MTAANQRTSFSACDLVFNSCSHVSGHRLDLDETTGAQSVVGPISDRRTNSGALGW